MYILEVEVWLVKETSWKAKYALVALVRTLDRYLEEDLALEIEVRLGRNCQAEDSEGL